MTNKVNVRRDVTVEEYFDSWKAIGQYMLDNPPPEEVLMIYGSIHIAQNISHPDRGKFRLRYSYSEYIDLNGERHTSMKEEL